MEEKETQVHSRFEHLNCPVKAKIDSRSNAETALDIKRSSIDSMYGMTFTRSISILFAYTIHGFHKSCLLYRN